MGKGKDPNLVKGEQPVEYTPDLIHEFKKCSEDMLYTIKKYFKVQHPVHGMIPFELHPYQEDMITKYDNEQFVITLASRQVGKTVTAAAWLLYNAIFNRDKTILIVSNRNANAMEIIYRIQTFYLNLPKWLKPGVIEGGWNKHEIGFTNGSRILSQATSENSGRGFSISCIYADEFAFVPSNIQEQFWTSISPTLATGGKCIITSTPNGDSNLFAQLWRGAQSQLNSFVPVFVPWTAPPGRDEEFKKRESAKIGHQKWLQEFECVFLSSDALLIDSQKSLSLTAHVAKSKPLFYNEGVYFWKHIQQKATYIVGVDPATGTGNDFSVIQVYDFPGLEQVAEFRSNTTSSPDLYKILKKIIKFLEKHNATIYYSVENNGVGEGMLSLISVDEDGFNNALLITPRKSARKGMVTTSSLKLRACTIFKDMIEQDRLKINSPFMLQEIKTFVRKNNNYSAQTGGTDDCISATLICVRIIEQMAEFEEDAHRKIYNFENPTPWDSLKEISTDDDLPMPIVM